MKRWRKDKRRGATPTLPQRRWLEALARVTRVETGIVWPDDLSSWVAHLQKGDNRERPTTE